MRKTKWTGFLPEPMYKTERRMSHGGCIEFGSMGQYVMAHSITASLRLSSGQTKRTCSSFVAHAANPERVEDQSERREES